MALNPPTTNEGEGQVTGGPLDNSAALPPVVTPDPIVTPPPAADAPAAMAPIYVGGKKFTTQEEMLSYFSELESRQQIQAQHVQTPTVKDVEKELAELMFEDPAAYNRAILEQGTQRALAQIHQQNAQREAMETFYKKNPDLAEDRDIVSLTYSQNSHKLDKMHLDQAMDELATAARGRLAKLRQIPSGGRELPSGPAITTGATGGPGTRVQVAQEPLTFVEQIANLQRKRRKA